MKHFPLCIILTFLVSLFNLDQAFAVPRGYWQSGLAAQRADAALKTWESRTVKAETSKIISVLEDRIEDPEVLAKTRDKLLTLSDEEIRLVSSLCDRISTGERTARAEIVFSLVTALIVLS